MFRTVLPRAFLYLALAAASAPLCATTLMRSGFDELVAANETILVGEVVGARSYWNADGTFILTDVAVMPLSVVRGKVGGEEIVVTVMGGSVGDLTVLIPGGPELVIGRPYVLFLNRENLPGSPQALTVRDLSQGIFDVFEDESGALKAVSQANGHPLVPDRKGNVVAPGGVEGFALETMLENLKQIAKRLALEKEGS